LIVCTSAKQEKENNSEVNAKNFISSPYYEKELTPH